MIPKQKIGLASDHAGYALKMFVRSYLEEKDTPTRTTAVLTNKVVTIQTMLINWVRQ